MKLILRVCGKLSEDDLSFVTDDTVIKYLNSINVESEPFEFKQLFSSHDPDLINVLDKSL